MPSTLPTVEPRTPANSARAALDAIRGRSAKARIAANPPDLTRLLPLLKQAMSETGLSQKAMAINAGQTESVISEALAGRRHFDVEWWWAQPDTFLLKFFELVMDARELTPANISAVRRRRIVELVDLLLIECA